MPAIKPPTVPTKPGVPPPPAKPTTGSVVAAPKRGSWKTVVVVERERDARTRLARLVREAAGERSRPTAQGPQLTVAEGEDGQSGWALIEQLKPDLVITEILLENLSGLQLLRRAKDKLKAASPPFFFVTEMSNEVDRYWALRLGAAAYVIKPFEDDFLRKRISKFFTEGVDELSVWPDE